MKVNFWVLILKMSALDMSSLSDFEDDTGIKAAAALEEQRSKVREQQTAIDNKESLIKKNQEEVTNLSRNITSLNLKVLNLEAGQGSQDDLVLLPKMKDDLQSLQDKKKKLESIQKSS